MPREGIMVGVLTMLAYVNSVSPSCVYFIIISRLRKQTSAESEHSNQNQNQKCPVLHLMFKLETGPNTRG